ncbi:MAG: hypothetical protein JSS51_12540 [Planctomycetes bacterium]|nr:hypothetical protein [Planctomycetota bacterium]
MLSKRGAELVFLAILTAVIALCCGLVASIAWFGIDAHLVTRTTKAALLGWLVAFPVALLCSGKLRSFAMSLSKS